MEIIIIIILGFLTFLNIIVPLSGSAVVTPLLALLVFDPQVAIALSAIYFLMGAIIRVVVFRKTIQWQEVKRLLPISILFAIVGAFVLVHIPPVFVFVLIFLFMFYFLYKKVNKALGRVKKDKKILKSNRVTYIVAVISGFFQGAGVGGGSDIRNGYLYSKNYSLTEVHGTTAFLGGANFLIATTVRVFSGSVTFPSVLPLLALFPFMIIATLIGKKVLLKINKKATDWIIISVMVVITVFLGVDIFQELMSLTF